MATFIRAAIKNLKTNKTEIHDLTLQSISFHDLTRVLFLLKKYAYFRFTLRIFCYFHGETKNIYTVLQAIRMLTLTYSYLTFGH